MATVTLPIPQTATSVLLVQGPDGDASLSKR